MTKRMEKSLNDQVNAEAYSAYLYLAMSAYFESISLKGAAHWMRIQAQEELTHVMKFFDYICDRRGRVVLGEIARPPKEWKSPLEAFLDAFKHEQFVTERINRLAELAVTEKDNATHNFLEWFVAEQVEEEASVDAIVQKLRLIEGFPAGLFLLDQELAQRTFTPPAPEA